MAITVTGKVTTWDYLGNKRVYGEVAMPFSEAREHICPVRYNALTGKGEQRDITPAHAKNLNGAMEEGTFTPTQMTAGLHKSHKQNLVVNEEEGTFSLEIDPNDPLPQTDGGHRYEAIEIGIRNRTEAIKKASDDKAKTRLQKEIDQLNNLMVGIRIFFDGNTKTDFIALQAGRPVDAAHMFSMKVSQKVLGEPEYKLAMSIAEVLYKAPNSPFAKIIRFDSRSDKNAKLKPISINTLCQTSASDQATSLIGLARIGLVFDADAAFLADCVIQATSYIEKNAPELTEVGSLLTPPKSAGTKGSATMLVGLGTTLAYTVLSGGRKTIEQEDLSRLCEASKKTMNQAISGSFPASLKRQKIGQLVAAMFKDYATDKHDGMPKLLLQTLSPGSFAASPFPKAPKATKEATSALPDVDGPVDSASEQEADAADATLDKAVVKVEETMPSGEVVAQIQA